MSNLPAGFVQIDLFSLTNKQSEEKPRAEKQRKKSITYKCNKCGKTVKVHVPIQIAFCGCGGVMKREGE